MSIFIKAPLLPYLQYHSFNIIRLTFLNRYPPRTLQILEKYGQNWAKTNSWFYLMSSCTNRFLVFYIFSHWNAYYQDPNKTVHVFLFFSNIFWIIWFWLFFVQNVISKFVKVSPQKLNNSLLEKSWAPFCAAGCYNCMCKV